MANIHFWGGGPYHPTQAQATKLGERLQPLGHELVYGTSRSMFEPHQLQAADLLILAGLDWSGITKVQPERWVEAQPLPKEYVPLSDQHFTSIMSHLQKGKPLLCHHSALLSFDERPEFTEVFDGRWIDGQSTHPPYQEFTVSVCDRAHPITAGLDDFRISDEIYYNLVEPRRSTVLLETEFEGRKWPLAWAGAYGNARIVFSALGHDMGSYASEGLMALLINSVGWLLETSETQQETRNS